MRIQVGVAEEEQSAAKRRRRMAPMWPESWEAVAAVDQTTTTKKPHLKKVTREELVMRERAFADPDRLVEMVHSSETGAAQMASLAKQWERRQAITVHLLRQQLEALDTQRLEAERKHRLIVEAHWSPRPTGGALGARGDGTDPICPMEEDDTSTSGATSSQGSSVGSMGSSLVDETDNSLDYWKDQAKRLEHLLAESLQREQVLLSKLQQNADQPAGSPPIDELRESLHRLDNFLHFTLRKAPVVLAHQDSELRYRFIFNPLPGLTEQDILGKTDEEIGPGTGINECHEMKREVLTTGRPMQREFVFNTSVIDQKSFLMSVEPVVSKSGETLGVNFVAVDVTEEASRREKLIVLREEAAVQKAMETELHRTLVITEAAMRAKQMLATMSHEIRSPLSGVVSMAQVLATTRLDAEQRPMVDLMNSSGEHVLELINDILDLSKAESGAMKLEAKKFRPRLVVKRVIQLAFASVQNKNLTLSGDVASDVPEEVVGDVLRIRQVLTNLVSNAIKFTSKGEVSIKVRMASPPVNKIETETPSDVKEPAGGSLPNTSTPSQVKGGAVVPTQSPAAVEQPCNEAPKHDSKGDEASSDYSRSSSSISSVSSLSSVPSVLSDSSSFSTKSQDEVRFEEEEAKQPAQPAQPAQSPPSTFPAVMWDLSPKSFEMTDEIWLHCEVTDTGIGIPEAALPTLFEEYTQATTTTARKYGGTGLGLAICKQLVGLMGGTLEVKSKQNVGSSFSFTLPLRAVREGLSDKGGDGETVWKPVVHTGGGGSDGKGKTPKGMDGKLRQMLRDSRRAWVSIGDSPLAFGSIGDSEKGSEQVIKEEENVLSSRSDPTVSSSSQGPAALETSELNTQRGRENPKTGNSASMRPNLPRKNASSLKIATQLLSAVCQKVGPTGPHVVEPTSTRRSPRILLAEDNNVNVVVAQSMLKKLGLSLEVVNNGAEAVDALQRNEYDLVLMDVSMPVMDGLEATRLIRKYEDTGVGRDTTDEQSAAECSVSSSSAATGCEVQQLQYSGTDPILRPSPRRKTPIIALTANAMAENVAECYNNGMDSFIAKPVTFEKLEQVLKQYIPWSEHRRVQAR